jgi:broad specificity phosphatase PhoE
MELHLLRHGETKGNAAGVYQGRVGGELTNSQTRALRFISFDAAPYDAIYSSPLARCVDTAKHLGIEGAQIDKRLAERNLGIFEGLTDRECEERFPNEFRMFRAFSEDFIIPDGESRGAHAARVLSWLGDALRYQRVLAITSGGTIDFVYRLSTKQPLHGGDRIYGGDNATLSSFEIHWPEIRLLAFDVPLEEHTRRI